MEKLLSFFYNYILVEHYSANGEFLFTTIDNSKFLLMFLLLLILIILTISLYISNLLLRIKIKKFLSGKEANSLEEVILQNQKDINLLKEENKIVESHIVHNTKKLKETIRNISTTRFRAGENADSNQSFATGFLNDSGDGVIISTLSIRNHTSIFAKPIKKYESQYELNDEEREVLEEIKSEHQRLR